ncbi:4-coumarate--CoA ligase 1 [Lamellibrachia satsuma]|nr:4-coumarate--CoA ligase 1 [Lamellibrachia satsuma]
MRLSVALVNMSALSQQEKSSSSRASSITHSRPLQIAPASSSNQRQHIVPVDVSDTQQMVPARSRGAPPSIPVQLGGRSARHQAHCPQSIPRLDAAIWHRRNNRSPDDVHGIAERHRASRERAMAAGHTQRRRRWRCRQPQAMASQLSSDRIKLNLRQWGMAKSHRTSTGELALALTQAISTMLVASAETIELAKQAANVAKLCQQDIVVFGDAAGCRPFSTLLQDDGKCFPENLDWEPQEDLVALPFSSGTTGLPKGVMLTHYNLIANVDQIRSDDVTGYVAGEDVLMGVVPWIHIFGQTVVALAGLKAGESVVSMPHARHMRKITFLPIVPPIMLFLAKHPMVNKDDVPSVHTVTTAAAPCGANTMVEVRDRLDIPRIRQGYGLTEASPVTHSNTRDNYRYDTCGLDVPNTEYKVVDVTTGEMLERRSEGEVCVRIPQVMKGYLDYEKATRETVKDGWLHTGDLGFADDDGHVVITDRIKELIKCKGLQVAPAELKALLVKHPAVDDSAVIGQPDERAGEVPRAYVVLKPNLRVSQDELQKFIAEQVAPYKQLRGGIEFRKEIPKSANGKILRRVLKDELAEENRRK